MMNIELNNLFRFINAKHSNNKSTFEGEIVTAMPFRDVTVKKKNK